MATVGANGALIARSSAMLAIVILGGLTGLLFGSFLNVVIYRVPAGISLSYPPSHCPECKHPISPLENIPVVSWLALRGKCRHCSQPIPLRYPATELATGAAFALAGAIRVVYLSQLRSRSEIATFVLSLLAEWTAIAAVIALQDLHSRTMFPGEGAFWKSLWLSSCSSASQPGSLGGLPLVQQVLIQ
jgi:leader peptidase (prepilin peptidase)/N-methyltransferase